jgi:hypothetical protein
LINADPLHPRCGNQQLFINQLIKINKIGTQNGNATDRSFAPLFNVQYLLSNIIMMSIAMSKIMKFSRKLDK